MTILHNTIVSLYIYSVEFDMQTNFTWCKILRTIGLEIIIEETLVEVYPLSTKMFKRFTVLQKKDK